jgi:hypothetical protein
MDEQERREFMESVRKSQRQKRKLFIQVALVVPAVLTVMVIIGNLLPDDDSGPSRKERERNEFCKTFPEECVPPDADGGIP